MNTRKIALLGILTAGAIIISIVESFFPGFIIPGIKLGLANIVILIILFELGVYEAILTNILRVFLVGILRGNIFTMGFFMSLSGAICSLGIMILFHLLIKKLSIIGVSVLGSLFHIFGQIVVAIIYMGTTNIIYYLPIISISAIVIGVFIGLIAKMIIDTRAIKKQRDRYKF